VILVASFQGPAEWMRIPITFIRIRNDFIVTFCDFFETKIMFSGALRISLSVAQLFAGFHQPVLIGWTTKLHYSIWHTYEVIILSLIPLKQLRAILTRCLNANVRVPSGPHSLQNGLLIFGIVCHSNSVDICSLTAFKRTIKCVDFSDFLNFTQLFCVLVLWVLRLSFVCF